MSQTAIQAESISGHGIESNAFILMNKGNLEMIADQVAEDSGDSGVKAKASPEKKIRGILQTFIEKVVLTSRKLDPTQIYDALSTEEASKVKQMTQEERREFYKSERFAQAIISHMAKAKKLALEDAAD